MKNFIINLTGLIVLFTTLFCTPMLNSQPWAPVGGGMGGFVTCLTLYNNQMYAGGNFITAGSVFANRIARWDGGSWLTVGLGVSGAQNFVQAMEVYNGQLYVGGNFTFAGGLPANYVARWNGASWSSLGSGTNAGVYDFDIYNGELIMCGNFITIAGVSANYVAKFNGSTWSALGSGMNQAGVYALAVYNGELIAAGNFATAGGVGASNIAKWNGSSWSALGSGVNNFVLALGVYNGQLYAGGEFTVAGGVSANNIARWNGFSWSPLGSGVNATPLVFYVRNNELLVGGAFNVAGGMGVNYLARWNGSSWNTMQNGSMNSFVRAMSTWFPTFYAGGSFTTAGGVGALFVARTDNPLPVTLSGFSSSVIKNDVFLEWETVEEINNRGFDIERKAVNGSWIKAGYVEGSGTTNETKSYRFTDKYLQKGNYKYRLKQIDYNGNFEYHQLANDVTIGIPSEFYVSQNYPNPSNPSSRIDYQVPQTGVVTVKLYDAAGREIATLLNEIKEDGYYTMMFDGKSLASGIYYFKLVSGEYSETKKMILIK